MENDDGNVADAGVREPLEGVVQCEGISRKSWMTKCVALQNDAGVVVGKGICHNVDSALIIDSDNQPLGDDCVAVKIAVSLSKRDVPSDWMFQLRAWHISRVFLMVLAYTIMNRCTSSESHREHRVGKAGLAHIRTRALEGGGTLTGFQKKRPYSLLNR